MVVKAKRGRPRKPQGSLNLTLKMIKENPGIRATEIVKALPFNPITVRAAIYDLEDLKLIFKVKRGHWRAFSNVNYTESPCKGRKTSHTVVPYSVLGSFMS